MTRETTGGDAQNGADGRFTDRLRARAGPAWTAAAEHRFVRELGAGELDDAVFRRYLLQDRAFLTDLVSLVGYAVGQAPTAESQSRLTAFLATLTDEESDYFERSFAALDVAPAAWADPALAPPTRAFRALFSRAAHEGGYAETVAALLPVEWVYREWATAVADPPERFYLAEWVALHADPAFASFVDWLRAELDREGASLSPRRRERVDALFEHAVDLEVAFFDAAYADGGGVSTRGGP